jgi:hypothetical protein
MVKAKRGLSTNLVQVLNSLTLNRALAASPLVVRRARPFGVPKTCLALFFYCKRRTRVNTQCVLVSCLAGNGVLPIFDGCEVPPLRRQFSRHRGLSFDEV